MVRNMCGMVGNFYDLNWLNIEYQMFNLWTFISSAYATRQRDWEYQALLLPSFFSKNFF